MKNRFNFDDEEPKWKSSYDDEDEGDDDFDNISWDETFDLDGNSILNFELQEKILDKKILNMAIKHLESSFFWKFRTLKSQLKLIKETYASFQEMLSYQENQQNEQNNE